MDVAGSPSTYLRVLAGHEASTMIVMSLEDRTARIKHGSSVSVSDQVAADIEADIVAGKLAPDTRLPSEAELSVQYGVARGTVRRAMEELRDRGKVVTFHGRGTFVPPKA
jgi:DNA-binding GntR family transcriptional regulator